MPVSTIACQSGSKTGSEYFRPWTELVRMNTAGKPISAVRRTSATAASTSVSGSVATGISRPPEPAQYSRIIQSLYTAQTAGAT